jgi:hypothetical protein
LEKSSLPVIGGMTDQKIDNAEVGADKLNVLSKLPPSLAAICVPGVTESCGIGSSSKLRKLRNVAFVRTPLTAPIANKLPPQTC